MGGIKKQKINQEELAQRSRAIINPNAQRHTLTVASVHASKTTVHVAHSNKPKAQPPPPAKPSLLANDMASTDPPTETDLEDFTCIQVPEEVGQTQVS